jgi:hypothetical protein
MRVPREEPRGNNNCFFGNKGDSVEIKEEDKENNYEG